MVDNFTFGISISEMEHKVLERTMQYCIQQVNEWI